MQENLALGYRLRIAHMRNRKHSRINDYNVTHYNAFMMVLRYNGICGMAAEHGCLV